MFKPSAKIIADSVNGCGDRITTFEVKLHRFVLAEFNTHRVNSRNFQSSRACPVEKMITSVLEDKVYPLHWGRKQKGMVADLEVDEADQLEAQAIWDGAREDAIRHVRRLLDIDIHKQVANRLLEPFMAIKGIVTATDYQNFFDQRCHPDAQPEIHALAISMRVEYDASYPSKLSVGDWHMPFAPITIAGGWNLWNDEDKLKIATGRCARVSYLNHDGNSSADGDIKLHDRLLSSEPAHLSPFEHCAIAMPNSDRHANFIGWQSYRNRIEVS